jgi:DNA-binding transcriptional MerR regulator
MASVRNRPVDVAREFQRSSDWLRNLERNGVIPVARRDIAGHRFYTDADVQRIREIVSTRYRPTPPEAA